MVSDSASKRLKNVKNKQRRQKLFATIRHEQNKARHTTRKERAKEELKDPTLKEERLAENVTQTIESKRVFDETVNAPVEGDDQFQSYFDGRPPKVLITTNKNAHKEAYEFSELLLEILPGYSNFVKRKPQFEMKDIAKFCANRNYTDVIVINEDKKAVNGLTFMHLPEGPTFYFSVSSLVKTERISGHGRATAHIPELILNNFSTRLGQTVGRLFQSLFPHRPEFEGRQVVTLHNQRDFIFFRRHRYLFKNEERVGLQELGPQFTLRLRRVQKGIRDEIEWQHRPEMDKEKKKFYL
ncbi:Rpf1p [Sugiyamaella lignohabitans]|uniref:Rpf1p n=1 Tax=Sugiyamaella lignohabitans TaxID=796027 RepID=A0A167CXA4_9ASCO|nr:Rpf1p [Sugiyamaella lignohabitans]ANB12220.1 Rpf1p [Sugiyamaella lignohabitans]